MRCTSSTEEWFWGWRLPGKVVIRMHHRLSNRHGIVGDAIPHFRPTVVTAVPLPVSFLSRALQA